VALQNMDDVTELNLITLSDFSNAAALFSSPHLVDMYQVIISYVSGHHLICIRSASHMQHMYQVIISNVSYVSGHM
jgi:hypothetical protein